MRSEAQFERLRERLADFADESLRAADFEEAARGFNRCRSAGIAGSPIDLLLCAIALHRDAAIFTTDLDFEQYARVLGFRLHQPFDRKTEL